LSIAKQIAFGATAGWVSRAVSILMGLVLFPVLFRNLGREELGVWLLLGQSWAVLGVLDFGLAVTLTRRIAFAMGKGMSTPGEPCTPETVREIADLVKTARILYRHLAVISFLVAFGLGCFSLRHLHLSSLALPKVYLAWGILCLSQSVGVLSMVWSCLLQGTGIVGWEVLLASSVSILTLSAQIVVASMGGGLLGLAIAGAAGAVTQRLSVVALARSKRPELIAMNGVWQTTLFRSMAPVALKAWMTTVCLVIVMNTDQFFIAGMQGARQIPSYRAAYSIFINLQMLAVAFGGSAGVFIAQLWKAGEVARVQRLVIHNLRLGLSIMVTGGGCVLGLGQHLFNLWIGHGNYIGPRIASIFFLLLVLETQSYIISTSSRATEDEAFVICTAAAAVLNVTLTFILGARYGLFGIALATLLAQGATSHWFMCYRGLRRLHLSVSAHVREVVAPVGLLLIVTLVMVRCVASFMGGKPDWLVVIAAVLATGVLLCGSIWLLVLDSSQRQIAVAMPARFLRAAFS
jgi:O-antigen/teichoic acid export membrane protein